MMETRRSCSALVLHAEAPVLRHAALGNVQIAEHLDARDDRRVPFLGDGCMACCSTPSIRYFTATSVSRASMWMSLARRSRAVKMIVSTSRTTGSPWNRASSGPGNGFFALSSSLETCSVKASVACSSTRCDCSVRFSKSPIWRQWRPYRPAFSQQHGSSSLRITMPGSATAITTCLLCVTAVQSCSGTSGPRGWCGRVPDRCVVPSGQ